MVSYHCCDYKQYPEKVDPPPTTDGSTSSLKDISNTWYALPHLVSIAELIYCLANTGHPCNAARQKACRWGSFSKNWKALQRKGSSFRRCRSVVKTLGMGVVKSQFTSSLHVCWSCHLRCSLISIPTRRLPG